MVKISATELARNLSGVLDRLERGSEEMVIVRNNRVVGKLLPGAATMTAMEAFADLPGAISDEEGEAWLDDCRGADRPLREEVGDPWE